MSTEVHRPDFRAFTVIKRGEGQDDFWLPIGAAFAHQSGEGFNLILQALPLPDKDGQCKIVLRPPKDDDSRSQNPPDRSDRNNKSGSRRR
ncbi:MULTISPECIES: hypothetical protein [unclassified Bradyrhizobium]|uniref:hypothetical protein n=1 Tax=unclassified Bradyrhizobium TaxID=2631580 RepID=UPI002916628D|nr:MULTISPECIES: hypothetical protein [unclassified Bradyrhizobium]